MEDNHEHPHPHEHEHKGPPPPPGGPKHDIPPHILKELFDLKEKVGKLEGMMEVILKKLP